MLDVRIFEDYDQVGGVPQYPGLPNTFIESRQSWRVFSSLSDQKQQKQMRKYLLAK